MLDERQVSALRAGELDPGQLALIAAEVAAYEEGREALYDGVRTTVAGLLRAHVDESECNDWGEVLTHLSGMALAVGGDDPTAATLLSTRLDTLRDLSADAAAHQRFNSVERIAEFPLYREIIRHLHGKGGSVPRAELVKVFSLSEPNTSRILKLLEGARLLRRERRDGGAVEVSLRPEGRRLLMQWDPRPHTAEAANVRSIVPMLRAREGIEGVPQATTGWSAEGRRAV